MTEQASAWMRLPEELRARPQWAVAGASKAPLSASADGKLFHTGVNRPSEWMSFAQAAQLAWDNRNTVTAHVDKKGRTVTQTGFNIGYILNESDPYACIDLDVKDATTHPDEPELHTTPEQIDRYSSIYRTFNSYTELSRSGKGLHIWVRADIGKGFRRDGVELYSRERFIICTGQVVVNMPIEERQTLVMNLVSRMRPVAEEKFHLEEFDEEEGDWLILDRATNAANSDKFNALWEGGWQALGFPSQSEADLALMSMLTFYSESNSQCRRLFRQSGLGKREKATIDDRYVNLTLSIVRSREQRERNADMSAMAAAADQFLLIEQERKQQNIAAALSEAQGFNAPVPELGGFGQPPSRSVTSLHTPGQGNPPTAPPPVAVGVAQLAPVTSSAHQAGETGIPWPPGLAGAIARFVYQSAPRPVKEVAIVAALGLLSGICGKAWHIPQSGLNLYIILIARSGVGKEAMHSGISAIIKACSKENPMFHNFIDFKDYASGPALTKGCVANPCFVNVSGEWGRKLKRLAQDDRDAALQTLRTQMTNLYQKSGPTAIVGGIGYSATDNNVASIAGVSYSMIGETTPGTFYESLTEGMMEDGFLSRFLIVEYDGDRPPENEQRIDAPDSGLKDVLNSLAVQATMLIGKDYSCPVGRDEEAAALMYQFNQLCDASINATNDESKRQMWNRAALKSLRIAALLAVADNWMTPCIRKHHVEWAQLVVNRDIAIMKKRLATGDVGAGDNARERKIAAILKDYLGEAIPASYKVPDAMRQNSIVPRSYLQIRTKQIASFNNHKLGPNRALDDALASLVSSGYLMELQKDKVVEAYSFHGKSFRVLRVPDFDTEVRI